MFTALQSIWSHKGFAYCGLEKLTENDTYYYFYQALKLGTRAISSTHQHDKTAPFPPCPTPKLGARLVLHEGIIRFPRGQIALQPLRCGLVCPSLDDSGSVMDSIAALLCLILGRM